MGRLRDTVPVRCGLCVCMYVCMYDYIAVSTRTLTPCVCMGIDGVPSKECRLMCMVRRMIGAQVYSVVCWLFGCALLDWWF